MNKQTIVIRIEKDNVNVLSPQFKILVDAQHLPEFQEMIAKWFKDKDQADEVVFEFIESFV